MHKADYTQLRIKRFFSMLTVLVFSIVSIPLQAGAEVIDFTRFLSRYSAADNSNVDKQKSFFGVPGSARLIITTAGQIAGVTVQLNGSEVVSSDNKAGKYEVPVTLVKDNDISVTVNGAPESSVSIRVKQEADIKLHLNRRVHFNTNVRNFDAANEFYVKIGIEEFMGFPDVNTQAMARAIGIKTPTTYDGSQGGEAGGYQLHGKLMSVDFSDALKGGMIDLIEFKIPKRDEPPYEKLNHLGIAKATMYTANIAADYEYMKGIGIKFISAPVTRSDGTTFAIFTDLDGTYYQLIEKEHDEEETETTHIYTLGPVGINVSDFGRSRAWYQMLGYQVTKKLAATDSIEVANAMGFDEKYEIDGAILTSDIDESELELVQWKSPYNPEPPFSAPANHLGIARIAFDTSDIEADVATLKAQGVVFLTDITPCCMGPDSSGSIVAFYDPDGAIIELAEAGVMATMSMMWWNIKQKIFN
jgi:catechol 2,3-dioxygenase-like lactoylglutathione lyase family enzyme